MSTFRRIIERFLLKFYTIFYLRHLGKDTFIQRVDPSTRLKLRVNSYDIQALLEIWRLKEYEDNVFTIGRRDVVIDIGAHIGAFSIWAARKAPQGQIYAYEPDEENYALLRENIALNEITNINTFKLAVSNKNGLARLNLSDYSNLGHTLLDIPTRSAATVPTISLADVLARNQLEYVDYLKIDAEGAEYQIVLSTPADVLRRIDKIIIEYHDYLRHDHHCGELRDHLKDCGFEVEVDAGTLQRHFVKLGLLKARRNDGKG